MPLQYIRNMGAKSHSFSKAIAENNGQLVHSQPRRLSRRTEHFEQQFSKPARPMLLTDSSEPTWMLTSHLSLNGCRHDLVVLEGNKALGLDFLHLC